MTSRPLALRIGAGLSLVLLLGPALLMAGGAPAAAHSFLVSTTPGQGERRSGSPDSVVLDFSEAVDAATVELAVRDARGSAVDAAPPELIAGDLSIRSSLPPLDDGIYVVSWQAFSDVDGHGSFGEHSFAVGEVGGGALPATTTSSSDGWWGMAASWLFFAGFAGASGSLVVQLLSGDRAGWERSVVRAGMVTALAGALLSWAQLALDATSTGIVLAAVTAALVSVATSVHGVVRRPGTPLGLLIAAAASWSARSHAASIAGLAGAAADSVHLLAGGIWVGALVAVVARLWRSDLRSEPARALLGRYSRLALGLVVLLAGAGVVSAFQLVPTWGEVWSTDYGRLLVAKTLLFCAALLLAAVARWSGIGAGRLRRLRHSTTAEGAVVVVVLALAGVLANVSPPVPASAAEALLGPPPLVGPVARDAGLAGQLNVEVASDGRRVDLRVFSPSGPVPDTDVSVAVIEPDGTEVDLLPRACGPGCFTQELALRAGTTAVRLTASAPGWTGGTYEGDLVWPPGRFAGDRLDEVLATMRAMPQLEIAETVDSGPGSVVHEQLITLSGAQFIAVEPYAGGNVSDVRTLPSKPERLALYIPGSQIFAVLVLDDAGRMTSSRLISPGHDIQRRFSYPEAPLPHERG
ncbi:MAG: copper resistance protein CopC [Actinobacteria bacterium]|nr:copper resistance protein CopC [Actinomycetota bacterium]